MPEYQLTIWVAFITAAAGVLGAIVGGIATYKTTARTLQHQEKAERRERELTRFENTLGSVMEAQSYIEDIYRKVAWNIEFKRPWTDLEARDPIFKTQPEKLI